MHIIEYIQSNKVSNKGKCLQREASSVRNSNLGLKIINFQNLKQFAGFGNHYWVSGCYKWVTGLFGTFGGFECLEFKL